MAYGDRWSRAIAAAERTIAGLGTAEEAVIWRRPASGRMAGYIWAPELHLIDGRWHMYFAAGDGDDKFRIRTYVMRSTGSDPLVSKWELLGKLARIRLNIHTGHSRSGPPRLRPRRRAC